MKKKLFIGIDVGGTKLAAGLVSPGGKILLRTKLPTPHNAPPREIVSIIKKIVGDLLKEQKLTVKDLQGIGIGVPGIVNPHNHRIIVTPNIRLSNFHLAREIKRSFPVAAAVGNDVNLGILAERWLGAARHTQNVIGIFPGTGIGGGVILHGELLTGNNGAAAEIGHMIMDVHGPKCSCGNYGCLEALASRWAIELDIRLAIKNKKPTVIKKLAGGNLRVIKSKMLRNALEQKDPVVTHVMKRAAKILGLACISVRHIFDPEIIVLGGGIIEACGDFILPIVKKAADANPFLAGVSNCKIVQSQLGDDAIILGAVALLQSAKTT